MVTDRNKAKCLSSVNHSTKAIHSTVGLKIFVIAYVVISKVLTSSNISHDEFVSINNELKVYDDMKKKSQI